MEHQAADIGAHFTYVDGIFIGVLGLSCLVGLLRGFTRELLGIINWVGAILLTLYGVSVLTPFARSHITNPFVADMALYITLFVVSIVVLSAISRTISNHVKSSSLGGIDRSLGMIFGLARTFILMAITFAGVVYFWPSNPPAAFTNARSLPLFKQAFILSATLVPKDLLHKFLDKQSEMTSSLLGQQNLSGAANTTDLVNKLSNLKVLSSNGDSSTAPQYKEEHRSELGRLILNHSDKDAE